LIAKEKGLREIKIGGGEVDQLRHVIGSEKIPDSPQIMRHTVGAYELATIEPTRIQNEIYGLLNLIYFNVFLIKEHTVVSSATGEGRRTALFECGGSMGYRHSERDVYDHPLRIPSRYPSSSREVEGTTGCAGRDQRTEFIGIDVD
jgi:hypothetical protein